MTTRLLPSAGPLTMRDPGRERQLLAARWRTEGAVPVLLVASVTAGELAHAVAEIGARSVGSGRALDARIDSCPEGVQHSHESLLSGLTAVPADRATLSPMTSPAGHIASLLGVLRPLVAGRLTVMIEAWNAQRATELIEAYRIPPTRRSSLRPAR
jgi:hypothetical protein